jgi:hypothetical protein
LPWVLRLFSQRCHSQSVYVLTLKPVLRFIHGVLSILHYQPHRHGTPVLTQPLNQYKRPGPRRYCGKYNHNKQIL